MLLFLRLLLARAFLPRCFRNISRLLCAALRCAEKQTRAQEHGETAAQRLTQRDLRMRMLLLAKTQNIACH
jgi:hypothetical protein